MSDRITFQRDGSVLLDGSPVPGVRCHTPRGTYRGSGTTKEYHLDPDSWFRLRDAIEAADKRKAAPHA